MEALPAPMVAPLGDRALLVRFGTMLSEAANAAAIACCRQLESDPPAGVLEICPNLISVLLRYDPMVTGFEALAGEVRLRLGAGGARTAKSWRQHRIRVQFGGAAGPDLEPVATALGLTPAAFIAAHNQRDLRVLTTGFAPGFVYCGFHPPALSLPRRRQIRGSVPPGTVLFAAGQTAITATAVPTGWHVIGRTAFRNFDPVGEPPTRLREGDVIRFEAEA